MRERHKAARHGARFTMELSGARNGWARRTSTQTWVKWLGAAAGLIFVVWIVSFIMRPDLPSPDDGFGGPTPESLDLLTGSVGKAEHKQEAEKQPPAPAPPPPAAPQAQESATVPAPASEKEEVENGTTRSYVVVNQDDGGFTPIARTPPADGREPPKEEQSTLYTVDGGKSPSVAPAPPPTPPAAGGNSSSSVDGAGDWCTPPWSCSSLSLSIPATVAVEPDSYFCTSLPVESEHQTLTKFIPKARPEVVHHMLVFACESKPEPKRSQKVRTVDGREIEVWNCLEEPTCVSSSANVDTGKIIYAWALGAGDFETGPDAGFVVGSRAGIEAPYLVLQSHFLKAVTAETAHEAAEMEMHATSKFPEKVISMSLFSHTHFRLPAGKERVEVDAQCCMRGSGSADLLAYRVHGHA